MRGKCFAVRFANVALVLSALGVPVFGADIGSSVAPTAAGLKRAAASVELVMLFRVHPVPPTLLRGPGDAPFSLDEFRLYQNTQAALMTSNFVLEIAVSNFGANSPAILEGVADPSRWLRSRIRTNVPKDSSLLELSISGKEGEDVKELAGLLEAVGDAYAMECVDRESQTRRIRLQSLEKVRDEFRESYRKALRSAASKQKADTPAVDQDAEPRPSKDEVDALAAMLRRLNAEIVAQTANLRVGPRVEKLSGPYVR